MKSKSFFDNFKRKFKIVIIHPDTLEEKGRFNASKLKVMILTVLVVVLIVVGTASLITFTPLKEFIPGYTDVSLNRRVYEMERRADSLERIVAQDKLYLGNIKRIIDDDAFPDDSLIASEQMNKGMTGVTKSGDVRSSRDSLFRDRFESESKFELFGMSSDVVITENMPSFSLPVNGKIMKRFNASEKFFGMDFSLKSDGVIYSIADGTVVSVEKVSGKDYTLCIQHTSNLISIYRNVGSMLANYGDIVRSGDAVAKGTALHFELWYNGVPLNPEDYFSFDGK